MDHDDTPVEDKIIVLRGASWADYQRLLEMRFSPYGSWTLEKKDVERGVEADECYVFRAVAEPERPDLAIEVVWTLGGG